MLIKAGDISALLESDLYSAGWNGTLESYPGQPIRQFAMSHLWKSFVKKYLPGTSDKNPSAEAAALELFMKVNDSCRDWRLDTTSCRSSEAVAIGEVKALLDRFFYPEPVVTSLVDDVNCWPLTFTIDRDFILSQNRIISGFGVGPGASIGAQETDFFSKLATSDLSATSQTLHKLYVDAIRCDPVWSNMENIRSTRRGYAIASSSRLSFAAKTTSISRTICTEPVLNMLFQKGIEHSMKRRLVEVFGLDLESQPVLNAEFARVGSLEGKYGTIDLSSASDSISIGLCKEILPSRVVDLLMLTRSPSTILPDGSLLELHMISSMGNAFTFPLQTMIFAAIVHSCYRVMGIHPQNPRGSSLGNFAVFGDDIIVDYRAYNLVVSVLNLLGFKVNVDKSFNEGPFRESCGHDYYYGHNVRGVYVKRLRDANDCYSAINRLVRWSAQHDVPLYNLVDFLVKKVRFIPVPYDESDDCGLKVPESILTFRTYHRDTGATKYRYSCLTGRKVVLEQWCKKRKQHIRTRVPRLPGWIDNPFGETLALLHGSIRSGSIALRTHERRAKIRERYSSRWDYVPFARDESREYAVDWKATAACYFSQVARNHSSS